VLDHYLDPPLDGAPDHIKTLLQPVVDFRSVLWRSPLHITFFGTFKSGKSTLLNALLGADILPTRVLRATGTVTRIGYTPVPYASVTYTVPDGLSYSEAIAFDERARYILLDLDHSPASSGQQPASTDTDHHGSHHTVTLGIPLDLLRQNCMLVDTPGLMDDMTLTERSYRELARSDLAVMVLSAYQLLSHREKEAIRSTGKLLNGNIVFVINQMDTVAAEERAGVLAQARAVLHEAGNRLVGQPRIFATEALRAYEERLTGAASATSASDEHRPDGVHAFQQWLGNLLNSPAAQQIALHSRLAILAHHLARASDVLRAGHDEAQQAARQAQERVAAAQKERQKRQNRAIMEDGLRLGRVENRLDELGATLVSSCVRDIQQLIATDPAWPDKLPACLHRALQTYERDIYESASAALIETRLPVPPFDVYHQRIRGKITAAEEWIEGLGFWSSLIPGFAAPLPFPNLPIPPLPMQPLLDEVGSVVDDLVQRTRGEAHQQIIQSVQETLRTLLPHLHTEARHYLEQIRARLLEAELPPSQDEVALVQTLHAAQQAEFSYRLLAAWCEECQDVIQRIQQAATGPLFWQSAT
jgi:hypothetical protein